MKSPLFSSIKTIDISKLYCLIQCSKKRYETKFLRITVLLILLLNILDVQTANAFQTAHCASLDFHTKSYDILFNFLLSRCQTLDSILKANILIERNKFDYPETSRNKVPNYLKAILISHLQ